MWLKVQQHWLEKILTWFCLHLWRSWVIYIVLAVWQESRQHKAKDLGYSVVTEISETWYIHFDAFAGCDTSSRLLDIGNGVCLQMLKSDHHFKEQVIQNGTKGGDNPGWGENHHMCVWWSPEWWDLGQYPFQEVLWESVDEHFSCTGSHSPTNVRSWPPPQCQGVQSSTWVDGQQDLNPEEWGWVDREGHLNLEQLIHQLILMSY